jgi:FAD/FMN-containing dehydrogenase
VCTVCCFDILEEIGFASLETQSFVFVEALPQQSRNLDNIGMVLFDSLSAPGLTVISSQDERFEEAVTSPAFIQNLPRELFPDAVFIAQSVVAVQAAVNFCSAHDLRICPRTGGHSWQPMWLRGKGSVILDLKSLNDEVHFDPNKKLITTGPGALNVNGKIPDQYFFPSGHCPTVPVGGFTLGGGYGIGFNKYGMASTLVRQVQVVLASGAIQTATMEDEDIISKAIFALIRGSYHRFPAVITELTFQAAPAPCCVLSTMPVFKLDDWKKVIQISRDIQHRGDDDAADIETVIVFGYSSESVLEATGELKTVGLALTVWSEQDEKYARALLNKYTRNVVGAIMSTDLVESVNPKTYSEAFRSLYPEKARYLCEGLVCDDRLFAMTDEQITEMVQPLADMWMSNAAPPSPSHSILPVIHRRMSQINNGNLACGFTPSLVAMSYAIYQDETKDEAYANTLKAGMSGLERAPVTFTEIPEGRIRTGKSAFTKEALESLEQSAKRLDPNGLFSDRKSMRYS